MENARGRAYRPLTDGRDELDDSWFDLPVVTDVRARPSSPPRRDPEAELDDSWFDRPGQGLRRSDVIGR